MGSHHQNSLGSASVFDRGPYRKIAKRAVYVRTSTDDNDGSAQLHELAEAARVRGWGHEYAAYLDRGESGAKDSRPEWDELREQCRRGRVREVMATELSRLGRSVVPVVLALDELHHAGVRVILLRQGLDYGTPVGRAVAAILAAVAQLERDQAIERIRAGVRRAQEEGTRSGRPIGRPRRRVDTQKLRELRKAGLSWAQCARELGLGAGTCRRALEACQNPT
jgi:DNA invertase Pin-like site-specific DNA recombinase